MMRLITFGLCLTSLLLLANPTQAAHRHRVHPVGFLLGLGLAQMLESHAKHQSNGTVFATYYGGSDGLCGSPTANGERYNCNEMTAAHRTLPFGTHITVCGPAACQVVRINDRGPYANGASIDLSMAAAKVICGALKSCHVSITGR